MRAMMLWVAGVVCCAAGAGGAVLQTNTVAGLLNDANCMPAEARWTFGVVDAEGRMPFSVEWGGCTTQQMAEGCLLAAPGQVATQKPGEPQLPAVATLVRGIAGGTVGVQSCDADGWVIYTNVFLMPVSGVEASFPDAGPVWHTVVRVDPKIYGLDQFWPEKLVVVQDMWRGTQRLLRVECRLVCYNPLKRIVKVARRMDGVLSVGGGP